jgi:Inositol phospholipid synthesis protein Scs3p.
MGSICVLNMMEDIVLGSNLISNHNIPGMITRGQESPDLSSCWYTSWLKNKWRDDSSVSGGGGVVGDGETASCYGHLFDFSDHVVLFFSHSFPSMVFEASFCFLFPFLPQRCPSFSSAGGLVDGSTGQVDRNRSMSSSRNKPSACVFVWNTLLPILLLVLFFYLNVVTLLAVHSTAAYFHSVGEVIVGYLISLMVQIPMGWIIWADEWKHVRQLVGFPMERQHMD